VRLAGGGREAILCSDLMHHPLQVRYPAWSTRFCTDPDRARLTWTPSVGPPEGFS
jgi:hypothetical protein